MAIFEKRIVAMDAQLSSFSPQERAAYQKSRKQFVKRLAVWKRRAEAEWGQFPQNVAEGFAELEATWYTLKNKS